MTFQIKTKYNLQILLENSLFVRTFALAAWLASISQPALAQISTNSFSTDAGRTNFAINANAVANKPGDYKEYKKRRNALLDILHASPVDWVKFEEGTRELIRDFPPTSWPNGREWRNGYYDMMILMEHYEEQKNFEKVRNLAQEMIDGTAPEHFKLWAKGLLYRLNSRNKPVKIQFTAVDGREVDTDKLKGKVVLVDFWATTCGPCVAELPEIKIVYEKFHGQGFEVIGISCDTDKDRLEIFLKRKGIPWPQYFDGEQQIRNKLTQSFGIDGIPHTMLLDKQGCLRTDNIGAQGNFEEKIQKLLEEK